MNEILKQEENLIDLSQIEGSDDLITEFNSRINGIELLDKKVKVNLGNISLTSNQINSLKNIFEAYGAEIEVLYAKSVSTQLAAIGAGIAVSEIPDENNQQISAPKEDQGDSKEQANCVDALINAMNQESADIINEKGSDNKEEKTLYIRQTLRSGRFINFDGNVLVIGDCNSGSEIIATGDITVWGTLSGIAHAGSKGDRSACIRALRINAIQLRIADLITRRPDRLEVEKPEKSGSYIPEEAKISHGEIVIYPLNN